MKKITQITKKVLLLFYLLFCSICCVSATPNTGGYNVKILKVNTDGFPDNVFVEFTVTDSEGNFVDGLQLSDFELWDNSAKMYGCRKLVQDFTEVVLPIDVVFLVDNSASMDDPQAKINAAIPKLLDGLKYKGDVRAGLIRFGQAEQWELCPEYGLLEKNGDSFFLPLQTDVDVTLFRSVWARNKVNGSYEPYYEVLNWVADKDLGFRPNALKVIILLGNEDIVYFKNDKACNGSVTFDYDTTIKSLLTQADVANTLNRYGFQTFVIEEVSYYRDFEFIAQMTGGCLSNINTTNYNNILTQISNKIKGRYIMRYCIPSEQVEAFCDDEDRIATVEYKDGRASGSSRYRNVRTASIVRSKSTQMLDTTPVDPNIPVTIEIDVISYGSEVDLVKMYYRNEEKPDFQCVTLTPDDAAYIDGDTHHFVFEIPDDVVCEPYVRYYFEAYTHHMYNGVESYQNKVSSPPYHRDDFSWSIAVKPQQTPVIRNVRTDSAYPCNRMYIMAEAEDTGHQLTLNLHYRIASTPGEYRTVSMDKVIGDAYVGLIPATAFVDNGVEYYITATDESGLTGRYGTAENPVRVVSDQMSAGSRLSPMDIVFGSRNSILIDCESLASGDTIAAYYNSDCENNKTEYLMSASVWDDAAGQMRLRVYGSSGNAMYKDGYADGDSIMLRLIRGGKDYELRGHNLRYSPTVGEVVFEGVTMGVQAPMVEMVGELDFGTCNVETTKIITVKNTGCENLLINKAEMEEGNFILRQNTDGVIVPAGEELQLEVTYLPFDDSETELFLHTNTVSHKHCVKLKGKSSERNACLNMKLTPEEPAEPSQIELTVECREPIEADVSLRQTCSDTPLWREVLSLDAGAHTMPIEHKLSAGEYKISIYTSAGLCEHPFIVK